MSKAPNQPKRTRVLIKDLLFQERYKLTHSQMDLMSYIVNAMYWAISVDGFFVLATNKIMSDLPTIGIKTLEANLKALKDADLIKTKMVQVKDWNGKPFLRGIKLTVLGEEYNNHYITSMEDKERKEYKDKIKKLEDKQKELEDIISNLKVPEDTPKTVEKTEPKPDNTPPKVKPSTKQQNLLDFIKDTKKTYQELSLPICNSVPTWQKEVEFYINSYNKLTIKLPNQEYQQIKEPEKIHHFWKYLYNNPEQIGKVIDYSNPLNCNELIYRYRGVGIKLGDIKLSVVSFYEKEVGKVIIEVLKDGETNSKILQNNKGADAIVNFKQAEEIILKTKIE